MRKKVSYNVRHFRLVDGEKQELNSHDYKELADRCKLAYAFMTTGKEHVLVNK
ncbi:hypothetical protein [Pontibacillus litoralis]|uniref:Uncharacterized protein n=1 Tax=Pontibacillus litoralis JSM 072002 TaxID=1385512 RepID=A0A0A5G062_9BACI|nr:hypothetical protein [Pontibacillus litoralis]KGX84455.1 hypothetical protein N784_13405 [Pontibacillus litoralis JSM 072002]